MGVGRIAKFKEIDEKNCQKGDRIGDYAVIVSGEKVALKVQKILQAQLQAEDKTINVKLPKPVGDQYRFVITPKQAKIVEDTTKRLRAAKKAGDTAAGPIDLSFIEESGAAKPAPTHAQRVSSNGATGKKSSSWAKGK